MNYCEVVGFERRSERLVAALVRDRIAGRAVTVRARVFVNATGVWGEALERLTGAPPAVQIAPSKGVHLVLPREKVGIREAAVVLPETDDQRLLFIVPFHDVVVIGTTDTIGSALGPPLVDDSDVEYLLTHANRYLLDPLARADVISAFAGYRPLIRRGAVESTARLSRSHVVIEHPHGMISILGGKLTTFRRMAEETVDRIDRRLGRKSRYPTRALRFAGRERLWDAALVVEQRAMELGVFESVPWLLQAYGSAATAILDLAAADPDLRRPIVPGLPYLLAEVVHACREEQAERLSDVLERRTWVLFADRRHGLGAVEEVSRIMARELGWSEDFRRKEVDRYRRRVQELCGSEDGIAESFAKTRLLGRRVDS